MTMLLAKLRRSMARLEQRLANQAELREERTITNHIQMINAQIGKPAARTKEPMPYRLHIAIAFALLASGLVSLYVWSPV